MDDSDYEYCSDSDGYGYESDDNIPASIDTITPRIASTESVSGGIHLVTTPQGILYAMKLPTVAGVVAKSISNISELFAVTPDVARLLLHHFRWDEQRLQAAWFDNAGKVLAAAHITAGPDPPHRPPGVLPECPVTLDDDVPYTECDALPCLHWASKAGWRDELEAAIQAGPAAITATCIQSGCHERVRRRIVADLVSAGQLAEYDQYWCRSWVDENPAVAWCPAPGCEFVLQNASGNVVDARCECGHEFCFLCKSEAHRPASCAMVKAWELKNNSESENTVWIMANTKPCPKCGVNIEKNQGCNHMTCRRELGGCSHEFCWMCLQPWSSHGNSTGGYYSCNKFEKDKTASTQARTAADAARVKLDKYLHYFSRFDNHERAARTTRGLRDKIAARMDELQSKKALTYKDVECLDLACKELLLGRQVLKWTYVFAFYCDNPAELELFEFLQQKCEENSEQLLELLELRDDCKVYLETPGMPTHGRAQFMEYLLQVKNTTAVAHRFMLDVLAGVDAGLVEDGAGARVAARKDSAAAPAAAAAAPAAGSRASHKAARR